MRTLRITICVMLVMFLMAFVNVASAITVRGIDIDFVTIGNAGNTADSSGYGAVGYDYSIEKYEVTNTQWNTFISAAGAPTGNPIDAYNESAYYIDLQQPTNNVSWYEAAQFCNYLTSGDKSKGAYLFNGNNSNPGDFLGIDRDSAVSVYGIIYVIPTEDEWYKAAYYTGSSYSTYANGQETIPSADNGWNYVGGLYIIPWDVSTGTEEQNGTYDIMGNVLEWNEAIIGADRTIRGGSFNGTAGDLRSSYRINYNPHNEWTDLGFRVASVPEPATLLLLCLGALMLIRKG